MKNKTESTFCSPSTVIFAGRWNRMALVKSV